MIKVYHSQLRQGRMLGKFSHWRELRYLLYCKIWRKRTKTKKKVSDEKNCFRFHWPYVPYTIHGGRLADGQQSIQVEHLVHKKLRRSVGFAIVLQNKVNMASGTVTIKL